MSREVASRWERPSTSSQRITPAPLSPPPRLAYDSLQPLISAIIKTKTTVGQRKQYIIMQHIISPLKCIVYVYSEQVGPSGTNLPLWPGSANYCSPISETRALFLFNTPVLAMKLPQFKKGKQNYWRFKSDFKKKQISNLHSHFFITVFAKNVANCKSRQKLTEIWYRRYQYFTA